MNKRKAFAGFALITFVAVILINISSCKPESNPQPLEPISLVSPDTPIIIKFTTDRPITWIMGLTDVDTLIDSSNYTPTYEDTLFRKDLTILNPRQNLYTYTGSYHVADSLLPFSVVRFKVSFQAGSNTFETGQNYPQGIKTYSKEFKVNVR